MKKRKIISNYDKNAVQVNDISGDAMVIIDLRASENTTLVAVYSSEFGASWQFLPIDGFNVPATVRIGKHYMFDDLIEAALDCGYTPYEITNL